MDDLFSEEQKVLDEAIQYASDLIKGAELNPMMYHKLVREYHKILKLLRRYTKLSDRSVAELYEKNLNLENQIHCDKKETDTENN